MVSMCQGEACGSWVAPQWYPHRTAQAGSRGSNVASQGAVVIARTAHLGSATRRVCIGQLEEVGALWGRSICSRLNQRGDAGCIGLSRVQALALEGLLHTQPPAWLSFLSSMLQAAQVTPSQKDKTDVLRQQHSQQGPKHQSGCATRASEQWCCCAAPS